MSDSKSVSFSNQQPAKTKVNSISNSKNAADHKISVARDLETLLFATPDPNNNQNSYFKPSSLGSGNSNNNNGTATISQKVSCS